MRVQCQQAAEITSATNSSSCNHVAQFDIRVQLEASATDISLLAVQINFLLLFATFNYSLIYKSAGIVQAFVDLRSFSCRVFIR
jgi:hypothetical protein